MTTEEYLLAEKKVRGSIMVTDGNGEAADDATSVPVLHTAA